MNRIWGLTVVLLGTGLAQGAAAQVPAALLGGGARHLRRLLAAGGDRALGAHACDLGLQHLEQLRRHRHRHRARVGQPRRRRALRRVSLRNRNPKAVPDAWERATLEDFDRRAAAKESPATLERAELVQEDGKPVMRYMRALPTAELCTQCHGTPERLSAAVTAQLKTLYPDDRAVGYRVGEIRGAITLRRPAP